MSRNAAFVKVYKGRIYLQDDPQSVQDYGTKFSLSSYGTDGQRQVLIPEMPTNLYLPGTDSGFMPVFSCEERSLLWAQRYVGNTELNYLVDLDTGEMHTITQTQYRDGMNMGVSLMAQTNDGRWLVGYKPHSDTHNDRCDYGFIDPQAFMQGSTAYTPVTMWD